MRFLRALIAAVLLLPGAAAYAQTHVNPGFNLMSTSQDVQLGQQASAQVDRQMPVITSSAATRLVERLGARLAAQAPGPDFAYHFKVLDLSDVNAFALPGGYVYIDRGLIQNVRTEGQLAGVMAHEISHVALRHPTSEMSKAYAAQTGAGLVARLLTGHASATTRNVVNAIGGVGLNMLTLKYSRSAEQQADIEGAQIMARAGYDPNEMADFFAWMRQQQGSNPSRVAMFLSDHPAPANREARVRQEARLIGAVHRSNTIGGLASAQAQLRAMPPARSMAQAQAATAGYR